MGNSLSHKKKVTDSLRDKVDGIPVWPPIQKNLRPYDVVEVGKDGSVNHVGNELTVRQLISDDPVWKDINEKIEEETRKVKGFSFEDNSEDKLEFQTSFLESVGLGLSANAIKGLSIKMNDREIVSLQSKSGNDQPLKIIEDAISGQSFGKKLYNIDKYIYVVTEVTNTKGFTLSSTADNGIGANVKFLQDQVDAKIGRKSSSEFDTQGNVSISFKALRFKVKNGVVEKPKFVKRDWERSDARGAPEEIVAQKSLEKEQSEKNCVDSSSVPEAKTKWALLIGNNDYSLGGMQSLRGCVNDVNEMEKFIVDRNFDEKNIDKNINLTYEKTVEKMEHFIRQTKIEEDDLLVFYYAGHGSERRSDEDSEDKEYEQTIVPVDSFHDGRGPNRDISRDMIQGWVKKLAEKGVRTMLFFDSCHSGGVIRGDDIPQDARAARGDERPKSQQHRPTCPSWALAKDEKRGIVEENAILFSACKSYQYAKEIPKCAPKNGAFTSKLISLLQKERQDTFVQLKEQLIHQLSEQKQTPDIDGNVDTVAFCIDSLILKSPLPYTNVDINPICNDVVFDLPLMLPYVTKGSEYTLFEISDGKMDNASAVGKFTVDKVMNTSKAKVRFSEKYNGFEEPKRLRAVETMHNPDDTELQHYTKVFVENGFVLETLKRILSNLKAEMYDNRNKFPVKDLPKSCFIKVVEDEKDADVFVCYSATQASHISVKNTNGELLLPLVEIDAEKFLQDQERTLEGEVHLVASYIASYAHWNMVQRLENKKTQLSEDIIKVDVVDQDGNIVEKNSEGYYDMKWNENVDTTQDFSFKFELKSESNENYLPLINIVSLDVDYGVYNYDDVLKEKDSARIQTSPVWQECSDIMKKYEDTEKWCNPFCEWKFFVSTLRNDDDDHMERSCLDDAMGGIESKCLRPSDYSKCDYHAEEGTGKSRDKARKREVLRKNDWTCISVKLKFDKFHNEYGRTSSLSCHQLMKS